MWKKNYSIIFISFVLFTVVKGSCLEYGHSCWGAHGKRSDGKVIHGTSNLRNNADLNIFADDNTNVVPLNKPLFETFEDLTAQSENSPHSSSDEEAAAAAAIEENDAASKFKRLLRKRTSKFRNRKNTDENVEQQQLNERWRKIPLFNLKKFAAKSPLNIAENDLMLQLERQASPHGTVEEGAYYDFQ